jgi:hypothetical protein
LCLEKECKEVNMTDPMTGDTGPAARAHTRAAPGQRLRRRGSKARAVTNACQQTCPISLSTETSCPEHSLTWFRRNPQSGFAEPLDHVLRHGLGQVAELKLIPDIFLEIRVQL